MKRVSFADMECPIARCAELIGDGWSLLVLRNAFFGVRTFQDFEQALGVPASTLTRKLKELTRQGLLSRERYQSNPPRDEYRLTEKGRDLLPVLVAMAAWGNRWLAPNGSLTRAVDPQTGEPVEPVLIDRRSGRPIKPGSMAVVPGRGASDQLREFLHEPLPFPPADV